MSRHSVSESLGLALSYLRVCWGNLWNLEAKLRGVQIDATIRFEGRPIISRAPGSTIRIGSGVAITSATRGNPLGCFQPSVLRTLAPDAELILDSNVGISGTVLCSGRSIRIGSGTIIGSGAMIIDNDFHAWQNGAGWINEYRENAQPIDIGRNVFIGARAIVLKGIKIGDRAVIGAGSVVTRDVPEGAVAAGNPARIISSAVVQPLP